MSNHVKIVMNDIILASEVSDMEFYSNQQYQCCQHPTVSGKSIEWSTVKMANTDKTVIRHQHEFTTTQLGLKTLKKRAV